MKPDPIGNDVRKVRRARRLGSDAVCVLCGESNPIALRRVDRSLLELHHVGGEANDGSLVAIVCRNCHALLSEAQHDSGVELQRRRDRASTERLEAVLRGLADFFALLVARLREWADELHRTVSRREDGFPNSHETR
jgi:hypothetical protein